MVLLTGGPTTTNRSSLSTLKQRASPPPPPLENIHLIKVKTYTFSTGLVLTHIISPNVGSVLK